MDASKNEVDFEDFISHTIIKSDADSRSISIETKHTINSVVPELAVNHAQPRSRPKMKRNDYYDDDDDDDDEEEEEFEDAEETSEEEEESDPEYSPRTDQDEGRKSGATKRPSRQKNFTKRYASDSEGGDGYESSDTEWNRRKGSKDRQPVALEGTFQCDECDKKCVSQRGLLIHKSAHKRARMQS